jgi:CSLREA domain-containing protein
LPLISHASGLNPALYRSLSAAYTTVFAARPARAAPVAPGGIHHINGADFTTVFVVTKTADTNDGVCSPTDCSLRDAIIAADAGPGVDTITFNIPIATDPGCNRGAGPCTISLDSVLPDISGDTNINGPNLNSPGDTGVIVERSTGITTDEFRVFTIDVATTVGIDQLTISNGKLSDINSTDQGGGILNAGTLTLTNSTVSGNSVSGNQSDQGGGIYNSGTLTVTNCVFSDNSATGGGDDFGGAIFSTSGTATVSSSTFSDNKTDGNGHDSGGAISLDSGTLTVTNSTLSTNSALGGNSDLGGAIYINRGSATIMASTISENTSAGPSHDEGGGIYISDGGSLNLINSTLSANSASGTGNDLGGGISISALGVLQLTNCTIASNSAGNGTRNEGGGIDNLGIVSARNTIIALNTANSGPDVFGAFISLGHNFIGKRDGSIGFGGNGDQVGTVAGPKDPLLGALANNGGPTQTRALLTGSTAIDQGDDCVVANLCLLALGFPLTTDQRGLTRESGMHVDIGAFELNIGNPGTLHFLPEIYITTEGNSTSHTVMVTVIRDGGSDGVASVHYATSDGTATIADNDYVAASGNLTWLDGDATSRTFNVVINGDLKVEPDETINLTLSNAIGAILGVPNTGTITIVNDDQAPVAFNLSGITANNTLRTFTLSATDSNGNPQTFSIVTSPLHGTLSNFGAVNCVVGACTQTVDYTPANGYVGADSFTYKSNDGVNDSNIATVSITVLSCPTGVVHYYPGDRNASDVVGNSHGVLTNGAFFAPGKVGMNAFSFDGVDDFVKLPDDFLDFPTTGNTSTTPFTFSAWFKTATSGVIIGQQTTDPFLNPTSGWAPLVYVGTDHHLHVSFDDSGTTVDTSAVVDDNVFHQVAVTYDSINQTVFVDGVNAGSRPFTKEGFADHYKYQLGTGYTKNAWPAGNQTWMNFNGLIDEVQIFNRALSTSEVQNLFTAPGGSQCLPAAPNVTSIVRANPNPTTATSVNFTVTFDAAVTGVDVTDFVPTTTGSLSGATVSSVTPVTTSVYSVTVNGYTGIGTLRLDLIDNDSIQDGSLRKLGGPGPLNGSFLPGEVYNFIGPNPPVASNLSGNTLVNTPRTFTLSATDPDGDAQTFSVVAGPQHGSLSNPGTPNCSAGHCTQTIDYTPANGYTGADSFAYKSTDGLHDSNIATVSITVTTFPCTGLVHWYPGDRNASDLVGSGHGTLVNGATFGAGQFGNGFSFDGVDDFVKLPDNLFPLAASGTDNTPLTFSAWFKTTTSGVILGQQNTNPFINPNSWSPAVYVGADGLLRASVFYGGTGTTLTSAAAVNDNLFHQVVVTYDGATETLYLDGASVGSRAHTNQIQSAVYKYQLGTGYTASWPSGNGGWLDFNGVIDEVQIFNRGLSGSEVQAVFSGTAAQCVGTTPQVTSITRADANPTTATSVNFTVTFSVPVTGVDGSDFLPVSTGSLFGAQVTGVSGSGRTYNVTVSNYAGSGTLRLDLTDNDSISDGTTPLGGPGAGNGSFNAGESYTINGTNLTSFVVTKTADTNDGECSLTDCSLREAIIAANFDSGADTITFNIPNTDPGCNATTHVCTIDVGGTGNQGLPNITSSVVIDGYSQTGASVNTLTTGGSNAVLLIELRGTNAGNIQGLRLTGGSSTIKGLVINRFTREAIVIAGGSSNNNLITGNYLGVNPDGTGTPAPIGSGNDLAGMFIQSSANTIGGTNAADYNIIAFNGGDGVTISSGTGNLIRGNSIFSNGTSAANLGIELGSGGVLPNDPGDADTGANNLQNFPVLTSALVTGETKLITGTLNSNANRPYIIDFYSNLTCDTSGNGEGKTYLGSTNVTTDASGNVSFSFNPDSLSIGDVVTATATDVSLNPTLPRNDTSEFSACLTAVAGTPGSLQFTAANYDIAEGNSGTSTVTITVTRTGGSDAAASVNYTTADGTATTAGGDYDATSGTFSWSHGDATSRSFNVTIHGDKTVEANEIVMVILNGETGAALGSPNPATITILNDDHAPVAGDVSLSQVVNDVRTIPLSGNDADGDAQTFTVVNNPQHGTLSNFGAPNCVSGACTETVQYTPTGGYTGPDSFTYKTNDGANDSDTATVSITVFACNPVFTVTSLGDGSDVTPGDAICDDGTGQCTLRAAIEEANADRVCGTLTIDLTAVSGQVNLNSALPAINANVNLNGPGAGTLTVQRSGAGGTPAFGVFNIASGVTVSINALTISNGLLSAAGANQGGGIYNSGALTISKSTISGNSASGTGNNLGGGIFNSGGTLAITNSTISGNHATGGALNAGGGIYLLSGSVAIANSTISGNDTTGGTGDVGGGIYSASGSLTVINSTIANNIAHNGISTNQGGGLFNSSTSTTALANCTLSGNSVGGGSLNQGGGIFNFGSVTALSTIISGNTAATGPDVSGALTSKGHNLVGNTSGATIAPQTGDLFNGAATPLNLGALANNGGPTQTMALGDGSVAINGGTDVTTLNGAIDGATTTVVLADATSIPAGIGFLIQIDAEQMSVASKATNTLTVVRGANSTSAAAHSDGAAVNPAFDQRDSPFLRKDLAAVEIGAYEQDELHLPVDIDATANSVDEGAAAGTTVGITAQAVDAQGVAVSYSLTADSSTGGFIINPSTGVVTVADSTKLNYEGLAGHIHTITVQASAGPITSSQNFTIAVKDVAPSTPTDSDANPNSVTECAPNGTLVGITASSTDPNGPAVTYSITGDTSGGGFGINSSSGVVTLVDSTKIDYETAPGHAHSITVVATGGALTSSQIFTIAVADLAPVGTNDSYSDSEGVTLNIPVPGVLVNDSDCRNGATLTAILATPPSHASSFTLNANGSFSYMPNTGYFGSDSFTYQPNDGTLSGNLTTVNITISPVASTPSVTNATTLEDTQTAAGNTGELVISRNVNDGAEVTYFKITNIQNGKLFRNDGLTQISSGEFIDFATAHAGLKFKPGADFNNNIGICSFDVQASLSNSNTGLGGGVVTATISVTPVNDQPRFTKGPNQVVVIDPGPQSVNNWATGIATGPPTATDETGQALNFIVTNDNNALFSAQPAVSANGTLTYTPATGVSGFATVTVRLQDNGSGTLPNVNTSGAQTFTITVNCMVDVVTNTNDSGAGSLRDVIANACAGDTVTFSNTTAGGATNFFAGSNTITLTTGEIPITKNLEIDGPGAGLLTISGNNASRVFNVSSGTVEINDLTVSGGMVSGANIGGGIVNSSTLTLINVNVSGNTAAVPAIGGGGLGNTGTLNVINSTVTGNSSTGGANGGGIYSNGGTLNIVNSTVSSNSAVAASGGGIYSTGGGTLNILLSTINNNSSGGGAGIRCIGPTVIVDSTISGNLAAAQGGGINNSGTLSIYNTTITGNKSNTSNTAGSSQGAGISTSTASILKNTIVAGNENANSPAPNTPEDINGSLNTGSSLNNLIGDAATSGGLTNGTNGNIVGNGGVGTIDINTVLNTTLNNNGGATSTHLLVAGSPAINSGADITTLNGAIDGVTNTVTVTDATSIPAGADYVIQVDDEQMTVLTKASNTLTVFRGAGNSIAVPHNTGAAVNPAFDQRGFARLVGGTVDIGSVEANLTITATAGTPQTAVINTAFATQLQATVTESNVPQSGVAVTFTAPGSGASGTFSGGTTVNTNGSGVAIAPPFTANATAGGPYEVIASLAGNTATANFSLTNTEANQTINFTSLPNRTYGDPDFTVNPTASSSLPVTLSATGFCTVTTPAPGTVHLTGAGPCSITASQPGDANYNPAADVTQSFTIAKADQTITFGALQNKTFGDPDFTVGATATSGLAVSFGASGNCTINGNTVHLTAAGSCIITASQPGSAKYNAAVDVTQSFTIAKGNQTITFNPLADRTFGDADFTVNASASSGLAVSLAAVGNCTVTTPAPGTVHLTGGGSCTITASQPGDTNYTAAPSISRKFTINKAAQTITFGALANKTFGNPDFTVSATATSGLPVSFGASGNCTITGTTVHLTGAGSCTITASQAGNSNYNAAANVPRAFSIAQANQTITFSALANKAFGDPDFTVSASASSGLAVSFAATGNCTIIGGSTVHLTAAGSCTITASQSGNANYNAATSVPQSFTITKANQTITFGPLVNRTFGDPDFAVSATATSALPVSFAASGNCTINGNTVHLGAAGSCTITASQAGDSNYNAAANVPQSFTISKANQTITFATLPDRTFGSPDFTVSATATSALTVSFTAGGNCTVSGATVHLTAAGSCTITAAQAGNSNYNAAANVPQTFAITKAATTTGVTSSLNPALFNQSVTFTATVTGIGTPTGTVQFTDNGSNLGSPVPLNSSGVAKLTSSALAPGVHTITAVYSGDGNLAGSTGILTGGQTVISQAVIKFSQPSYAANENSKFVTITVSRSGDTSSAVTVDYATSDDSAASTFTPCATVNGAGSPRCDFTTALGTLQFGPGETSKSFMVLISQDTWVEGTETVPLTLSNPNGAIFQDPADSHAVLTIVDDDSSPPSTNAIDDTTNFVRQHYHDFLNREADPSGLAFWTNEIESCGANAQCRDLKRINVSAAFFLSIEFQNTGYYVERIYKVAFGNISATVPVPVRFTNFLRDSQEIRGNVIVGIGDADAQLEANKQAYTLDFVQRPAFVNRYPALTSATALVDAWNANAGMVLNDAERSALIAELSVNPSDPALRADVLKQIAENALFKQNEVRRDFVLMQYFGYLRRNPDAAPEPALNFAGFNFWLNKLNQFNGDYINAEMIKAFLTATEYRQRFGP